MRQIREVLRLRHEKGLSQRSIAASCGIASGTVSEYLGRWKSSGLGWPLAADPDPPRPARALHWPAAPSFREPLGSSGSFHC